MKKAILIIAMVLSVGFLLFGGVWLGKNSSTVGDALNGTNIYNYEDLQNAYNEGVESVTKDVEEYKTLIADYREQISNLSDELTQVKANYKDSQKLTEEQAQRIEELENMLVEANSQVKYYEELIKAYDNLNKIEVKFYVENEIYKIILVDPGTTLSLNSAVEAPTSDLGTFKGWSMDGISIVTTGLIMDDNSITSYYAVFEEVAGIFENGVLNKEWDALVSSGDIVVENNTLSFANISLAGDLIIPKEITEIKASAFKDCTELKSVNFLSNPQLNTIGESAFNGCINLTDVYIPGNVTVLNNDTFYNCINLTSVIFAENSNLNEIRMRVFAKTGLKTITIPSGCWSIGQLAFSESQLENVEFATNSSVSIISRGVFKDCRKLISIVIPESVTAIYDSVFFGCDSLDNVYINSSSIAELTSTDSHLCFYNPTIYLKQGLSTNLVNAEGYTKTSSIDGYDVYTK